MQVAVKVEVTEDQIETLLCSAIEGGSNYWANFNFKGTKEENYIDYVKNGKLAIVDFEEDEDKSLYLFMSDIKRGLEIMAERYYWHFQNILSGNDDAETADVMIQCALLKDIVYG